MIHYQDLSGLIKQSGSWDRAGYHSPFLPGDPWDPPGVWGMAASAQCWAGLLHKGIYFVPKYRNWSFL